MNGHVLLLFHETLRGGEAEKYVLLVVVTRCFGLFTAAFGLFSRMLRYPLVRETVGYSSCSILSPCCMHLKNHSSDRCGIDRGLSLSLAQLIPLMTIQVDNRIFDDGLPRMDGKGTLSHSHPPSEDPSPETDAIFAAELNKLSMKERDEVLQDVHGVSDVMEEKIDFIKSCFQDLEKSLSLIPAVDKAAYLRARAQNEGYVNDEKFLLMFLRADAFDTISAAARMVGFFQTKLELFGPEKLGREITLDDLDEDDQRVLESGYAQILPGRDRAGRAIFCLMPMIRSHRCMQNKVRIVPGMSS
jgi:hypothetical protein